MSRPDYHTTRLEPTAKDYIKEVYENHAQYSSVKNFAEKAVANNVEFLERQVEGADDLRRLLQRLGRVDGISVELPERTFNTKIVGENLSTSTKIEIAPQHLNSIDEITRSTEMSKGDAIRVCLIRELYKLSSHDYLLHEPRESDIENSWSSIENNVEILFSSLVSRLETKLVNQREQTFQKIAQDPKSRDDLAAHYQNYFKESPGYHRLQDVSQGEEILSALESLPRMEN